MRYVSPDSEGWSLYVLEGIREAVANAIAEHEREGRGDMVRAAQANPDGTLPPWPEKPGN